MFSRRLLGRLSRLERRNLSRRELLKLGLVASGGALLPIRGSRADGDDDLQSPPVAPFQREMPVPAAPQPVSSFTVGPPDPQCALDVPGFPNLPAPVLYQVPMRTGQQEIIPGKLTEIWGYTGAYPGPTFRVDRNQPVVVRFINELDVETSIHNHGGTTPAESDGFPNDFIFPGEFKDYCYPNIADEDQDSEFSSTQWYHDHAMDITGENVYMGLAGFYLLSDDIEKDLIASGVLPATQYDIPLVLQDRLFAANGSLIYNPMDHDGVIGDRFLANGVIQPKFTVQRRKYRFRILNGSNARVYGLRLSSGKFLQIGADTWLLPKAVLRSEMALAPAERADVIIDFTNAPAEVFLTNHLTYELDGGRKPEEDFDDPSDWKQNGVPLVKFIVSGPASNNATVAPGTPLRPHVKILASEIVKSRTFEFSRKHGAWVVNGKFFDPDRDDAKPRVGTAEKWTIKNSSGGWVHPIHVHLEPMQIQKIDGKSPPPWEAGKKDTILLGDFSATVFVKFHSFTGRYVFHCHNIEHEDMRMMGTFNVLP